MRVTLAWGVFAAVVVFVAAAVTRTWALAAVGVVFLLFLLGLVWATQPD